MNDVKSDEAGKKAGSRKREKGKSEGTQKRILAAAKKVFALYPFKAATTRLIASEADVDHPLIHYYFRSKKDLFEAVTAEMYEEFHVANLKWFDGLEGMMPREGFSLFLDRTLDYNFTNPEPIQLILINMVQSGNLDEIPGHRYILMHLERERKILEEKLPIKGSSAEVASFLYSFSNMVIMLIGARKLQAQVLGLDEQPAEYRNKVKESLMALFLPWLERLIFASLVPPKNPEPTTGN